jgi:DNA-binding response OmpR family regulator
MVIRCPRCGNLAAPAGHEDARAFYQCEKCDRVWMTFLDTSVVETATPTAKVLVVDDSNELLGLIGAWLQDEGYILFTATSGRQALDIAQSHDPDIVLLDVVIPPPDGCTVCESLQHRDRPPEIILMTGTSDPSHLRRVDELGGLVLLRKPFNSDVLLQCVRQAAVRRMAMATSALPAAAGDPKSD